MTSTQKVNIPVIPVSDTSLNLGDPEDVGHAMLTVARRSNSRPSLRKSGSENSNKSSDNLDPDDLLENF